MNIIIIISLQLRAQELEEEREARRLAEETAGGGGDADGGPREPPKRRSRGGVKHRERSAVMGLEMGRGRENDRKT